MSDPWAEFRLQSDDPWADFRLQPDVSVMGDVARSGGVGLARGVLGTVGLPGDIRSGMGWAADKIGIPQEAQSAIRSAAKFVPGASAIATGPTSEELQNKVESVTGQFYKPKTTAGEYAKTVGEFAPGALLPGGAVSRAVNVVAPAVGSELGGQLTKGTAWEPYARLVGALTGGVAGARGLTPAPATAERSALAATLEAEGVPLTAGQRTGNRPLQWFEAAAADTPLAAGRAAEMNEVQGRAFSGAVMRRMGASGDEIATPQAVDRAVADLSNRFEQLSARNTLHADQRFVTDLINTAQNYVDNVIPSQRSAGRQNVETIMRDVVDVMQQNGDALPGPLYQSTRSRLGAMADGVRESDPQLSGAIRGIRNALDGAMERSISPGDAAAWREARTQWKNWKAIEKAVSGAGSQVAEGFISPSQLRTAVAGQNRGQYARGQGDMADLARAGEALLKPLPQSGTAPRQAAGNMFASLAGMATGASIGNLPGALIGAAAPAIAGRAMLSRPVQAWLGNQVAPMGRDEMRRMLLAQQLLAAPRPRQ